MIWTDSNVHYWRDNQTLDTLDKERCLVVFAIISMASGTRTLPTVGQCISMDKC